MLKSVFILFVVFGFSSELFARDLKSWADERVNQHMLKTGTRIYHQKQNAELQRRKMEMESQLNSMEMKKEKNSLNGLQMDELKYGMQDEDDYYMERSPIDEVTGQTQRNIAYQKELYEEELRKQEFLEKLRKEMELRKQRDGLNYVLDEENMILKFEHK